MPSCFGALELGGQKSGAEFDDNLPHCVTLIAPALATEIAIKARGVPRLVSDNAGDLSGGGAG